MNSFKKHSNRDRSRANAFVAEFNAIDSETASTFDVDHFINIGSSVTADAFLTSFEFLP